MVPKRIIVKDKYPIKDLKTAEESFKKGMGGKRVTFKSGEEMVRYFRKMTKKKG